MWPVSLLTKWPTTICRFASVLSSNFSLKRKSLLQKFTIDFGVLMDVCMGASSVWRWVEHFKDGNTSIQDEPRSSHPQTLSTECKKERVDEIIQDDRLVTVDTIARTLGIGHDATQEMIESLGCRKVCAYWPKTTKVSEKPSPQNCCRDIDTKAMIFCSVSWQVTKAGFTISSLKRNGRVRNGTMCILHQERRQRQRQCHQLRRWWAQSSGMQRGWFWLNSWDVGKPSLLLVMSRHCTRSVVRRAVNVRDEARPDTARGPSCIAQ